MSEGDVADPGCCVPELTRTAKKSRVVGEDSRCSQKAKGAKLWRGGEVTRCYLGAKQ